MKYLLISDIHGSLHYLNKAIKAFNDFKCEKIICLGDVLYHGPRNDLPKEYNPKECIKLLNALKDSIICVKGNCDALVDQMVLEFEIGKPHYEQINNTKMFLTHGHDLDLVPHDAKIVLYGHTHISMIEEDKNVLYVNPGSISIPKGDLINSFSVIDEELISIYDFNYQLKKAVKYI